jgi:hypothetical protein
MLLALLLPIAAEWLVADRGRSLGLVEVWRVEGGPVERSYVDRHLDDPLGRQVGHRHSVQERRLV